MDRPFGVVLFSIVFGFLGMLCVLLGISLLGLFGASCAEIAESFELSVLGFGKWASVHALFAAFIGIGIFYLVMGYGLWNLLTWAWWIVIIESAFQFVVSLISMAFVGTFLNALFLLYFWFRREEFGIGVKRAR